MADTNLNVTTIWAAQVLQSQLLCFRNYGMIDRLLPALLRNFGDSCSQWDLECSIFQYWCAFNLYHQGETELISSWRKQTRWIQLKQRLKILYVSSSPLNIPSHLKWSTLGHMISSTICYLFWEKFFVWLLTNSCSSADI